MAIYHCAAKVISRSQGRSAVAAAAYRAGCNLHDERLGLDHEYARKQGVTHSEILAPPEAPAWVFEREVLWNQVEAAEKRKDAQLARDFDLALPVELTHAERLGLIRGFVQEQFVERGMIADFSIHEDKPQNPHFHLLTTMRTITEDGFGPKERDWNHKAILKAQREAWADCVNQALEQAEHSSRVDHRRLLDQGVDDRLPQIHLGPTVVAMQEKAAALGIHFDHPRLERYQEIEAFNGTVQRLKQEIAADTQRLDALVASLTDTLEASTATAQHEEEIEKPHEKEPAESEPPAKLASLEPSELTDQAAPMAPTIGVLQDAQLASSTPDQQAALGADPPDAGATINGERADLRAALTSPNPPKVEASTEPHESAEPLAQPDQGAEIASTNTALLGEPATDYDFAQQAASETDPPQSLDPPPAKNAVPIAEPATEPLDASESQERPKLADQEVPIGQTTTALPGEPVTDSDSNQQAEFGADPQAATTTTKGENPPPVAAITSPPSQPDAAVENAKPSPESPTLEVKDVETTQPIEPEPANAQRWQDLSRAVQEQYPDRTPEAIAATVAAIALRQWDAEIAAAILAESAIGKAKLELGGTAFQQWCDRYIENAKLLIEQSSKSSTRTIKLEAQESLDQPAPLAPTSTTPPSASNPPTKQDPNRATVVVSPVTPTPGGGVPIPLTGGGATTTAPDQGPKIAAPSQVATTPAVKDEKTLKQRETEDCAKQWRDLSQGIQKAWPNIPPERLTIVVAAVAINKWNLEKAADILAQSEIGKDKQAQGTAVFEQWCRSQLEAAPLMVAQQQVLPAKKALSTKKVRSRGDEGR